MDRQMTKRIFAMVLALTLFMMPFAAVPVYAEAKESISKTKLTMYTNMSSTLKVRNSKQEVKWKTSNKKIVSILGTKNQAVTIKSGKKAGSCTITATVGKNSYKCKVTVKNSKKVSRATLVSVKQTDKKIKVRVKLNNRTNEDFYYGYEYWIEKFENGKWKKMPIYNEIAFPDVALGIPAKSSAIQTYTISSDKKNSLYLKSDFKKGTYRIHVSGNFAKDAYNYVIFKIK